MRFVFVALIAGASFLAGFFAPLLAPVDRAKYPGRAAQCIEKNSICVGMPADQVLRPYAIEDILGGLIGVSCGFEKPGAGIGNEANMATLIGMGCQNQKYVASFSRGDDLTNIWVDHGVIVQLDRYPRHTIDL